ncbi:MAG: coenzyme gamma-glutamyl ligase [Herminiimonas sp.]|nr:coenzyme gamma-glutamyl ligase [Herminiimonas sp.]
MRTMTLCAPGGIPMVREGDDLCRIILQAIQDGGDCLQDGDVLVLAQKIVSKAEGRTVPLASVVASPRAVELAEQVNKDPRLVELVLAESASVLRHRRDVLIVEHRLGFVMANAGIDMSNVQQQATEDTALLLPLDPDKSCATLREELRLACGVDVGVIINDSHGRAWRNGTVGVAIGVAGLPALDDRRGMPDLFGRPLKVTEVGLADELASAASVLMGQADEACPVVLIRGLATPRRSGTARELIRPKQLDLFR